MIKLSPVRLENAELQGWTEKQPLSFVVANNWARYMPRGVGSVPRRIGRAFLQNKRIAIRTQYGTLLAVDPSELDTYTNLMNRAGWNWQLVDACKRLIAPGDVFYDIGANNGHISIELAQLFSDSVQVLAFEPLSSLSRACAVSASLNGLDNHKVYEVMLGAETGDGEIFVPSHSVHASAVSREPGARRIECLQTTLDQAIADGLPAPDVIKMDVEGSELNVVRGAQETLRKHAPAIVFESDSNADRFGYTREDLLDAIQQDGAYNFYFLKNDHFVAVTPDNRNSLDYSDVLAVAANKIELVRGAVSGE